MPINGDEINEDLALDDDDDIENNESHEDDYVDNEQALKNLLLMAN